MGVVAKCLIPQDTHGKAQDSTPYSRKQTLDQAHGGLGFLSLALTGRWLWQVVLSDYPC